MNNLNVNQNGFKFNGNQESNEKVDIKSKEEFHNKTLLKEMWKRRRNETGKILDDHNRMLITNLVENQKSRELAEQLSEYKRYCKQSCGWKEDEVLTKSEMVKCKKDCEALTNSDMDEKIEKCKKDCEDDDNKCKDQCDETGGFFCSIM